MYPRIRIIYCVSLSCINVIIPSDPFLLLCYSDRYDGVSALASLLPIET